MDSNTFANFKNLRTLFTIKLIATFFMAALSGAGQAQSDTASLTIREADVVIPAGVMTSDQLALKWKSLPRNANPNTRVPVVLFMHGSGGLSSATREFQNWLAKQGVASVAPDSFARPNRLTYKSPAPKEIYEAIHAQRMQEIEDALAALQSAPWADPARIFLAGTSEGGVAAARWDKVGFAGRMLFAWSCENNYFVEDHRTAVKPDEPVLNVISLADPYFSPTSPLNAGSAVTGHCGNAFSGNKAASIFLVPGAPHTLYNLPQVRSMVKGFLSQHAGLGNP